MGIQIRDSDSEKSEFQIPYVPNFKFHIIPYPRFQRFELDFEFFEYWNRNLESGLESESESEGGI